MLPPPPPPESGGPFSLSSVAPSGEATRRSIAAIRDSLNWYLIVLLLTLVTAVLTAALLLGTSALVLPGQAQCGTASMPFATPFPMSGVLTAASTVLGLVVLAFTIVAWAGWRRGIFALDASAGEFGGPHTKVAQGARRYYTYAVYTWIGFAIVLILLVAVFVVDVAGALQPGVQLNRSFQCNPVVAAGLDAALRGFLWTLAVVTGLYNVLLYATATQSLATALRAVGSDAQRRRLRGARFTAIGGAALSTFSPLAVLTPWLGALAAVGAALLVLAYFSIRQAYESWLLHPAVPGGPLQPRPEGSSPIAN